MNMPIEDRITTDESVNASELVNGEAAAVEPTDEEIELMKETADLVDKGEVGECELLLRAAIVSVSYAVSVCS